MNKTVIKLSLNQDGMERLNKLKEHVEADSNATVIRNALQLYEWYVYEVIDKGQGLFRADPKLIDMIKSAEQIKSIFDLVQS